LQERYPCNGQNSNASNVEISSVVAQSSITERYERALKRFETNNIKLGLIGTMQNNSKGIDIAIKALSEIKGVTLHVLGSGEPVMFNELAKKYKVPFIYDGFKSSKSEVLEWLDDIDIYIQPSFQEGLPRATIEAMSRGCPVITSNAGGLAELTLEMYIHNSGDYLKLRKDITHLIRHSDLLVASSLHSLTVSKKYLSNNLKKRRASFYSKFISAC
jgi:glycosyltransferase involved in cell wall biosynthesis